MVEVVVVVVLVAVVVAVVLVVEEAIVVAAAVIDVNYGRLGCRDPQIMGWGVVDLHEIIIISYNVQKY